MVKQEQEMFVISSESQICTIKTRDDPDKNVSSIDVEEQEQEMVIPRESQICAIKTRDDPDKNVSSIDVEEQEHRKWLSQVKLRFVPLRQVMLLTKMCHSLICKG